MDTSPDIPVASAIPADTRPGVEGPGGIARTGMPHRRIEGSAKVAGAAVYAGDVHLPGQAYAVLVRSTMARGSLAHIGVGRALAMPGALLVLTHVNTAEEVRAVGHVMSGGWANSTLVPLASPEIHHAGQIVALVVADTPENAQAAAEAVSVDYRVLPHVASLDAPGAVPEELAALRPGYRDLRIGDLEAGSRAADVVIEARYTTSVGHHNPIELPTTTCSWESGRLKVYEPTRFLGAVQFGLAAQLGMSAADVRVVAPFLGGHFGSKMALSQQTALVAVAARRLGRPVRLDVSRADTFTVATHRPETRHLLRLGARHNGELTMFFHRAEAATSRFDAFAMEGTDITASLYRCANIGTKELVSRIDRNTPGHMRAPPEMPYLFAIESAMDELAHELRLDPIELRRRNDTTVDPVTGKPFTVRPLMRCFDEGAREFGWDRRPMEPRSMRDGDWLVGLGCAAAARTYMIGAAVVRVTRSDDGAGALVETAHHETGNGLYTLLAIVASERLSLPLDRIEVRIGDSDLPSSPMSGASSGAATAVNAVAAACDALRRSGKRSVEHTFLPDGMDDAGLDKLRHGRASLARVRDMTAWTFGAQFAEVRVHARTGVIHVTRQVGAFAAGRIVNPLTAHGQLTGGMVWGLGSALLECTEVDERTGAFCNESLGEYLVATNADVGEITALFVGGPDPLANAEGVKGLGEIGIIGVNAAIANAVFNATGVRVRDLPIRLESTFTPGWLDGVRAHPVDPGRHHPQDGLPSNGSGERRS